VSHGASGANVNGYVAFTVPPCGFGNWIRATSAATHGATDGARAQNRTASPTPTCA
jgi:hypothetical protein